LNITDNSNNVAGSQQSVSLTGTGTATIAGVTATSLTFNSQNLGTTSTAQTFTLNNTGNAALSITGIAFTGTNPGDFGQTNTCGSSVAAGGSCTFTVTFTPTAIGSRAASLKITDNSNNVAGSQQSVSLTGTGTSPVVSLSAASIPFGTQAQGTTSTTQSITLTNTGNANLTFTSISVTGANSGDFAQTNTCASPVAANGTCTINVTFTPTAILGRTALISIADNAPASPQTVTLTGTGTGPIVSLTASTLNFGNQPLLTTSASQVVTLNNTGNGTMTITNIQLAGSNAGDFGETNTCGGSVAVGGSCTIIVTFKPTALGSRTASVSIADNASGSPQAVTLIGFGTSATAGLSATVLTFGSQSVGSTSTTQIVTLTNGGNTALSITSIQMTGANPGDFGQTNNCGSSVPAPGTCTINVTFTPTASGSRTATLTITDNATGSPQTVSLTGTGTGPFAALLPLSFTFANQPAATPSAAASFTLTNTGNATLNIAGIGFTGTNPGDFSQNTTCGTTLVANTPCTIVVTFTPAASGSRSGTLVVTDNSNNVSSSTQSSLLTGTGLHDVILSWTASPTSGVVGYYVFRGTTAGGESTTPLNSSPATTINLTYVDSNVTANTTYYYVVTAVASDGVTQSAPSNEASAHVPTP
jgi:hypothetical protein